MGLANSLSLGEYFQYAMEPLAMTVDEAAHALGCSRRQVFVELAAGRLVKANRVGRRIMITTASIRERLLGGNNGTHTIKHNGVL